MEYIGPISSAVMALVWVVYFQVFFLQYQRNNRPYLVIHHAQNESPDALCFLVNMGKEPIHVQCVQAVIKTADDRTQQMTVTEYKRINPDDRNIQQALRQGPVQPGGYLLLGSFRQIIMGQKSEDEDAKVLLDDVESLELRVAVVHGPSKFPVGVRRHFILKHEYGPKVFPQNIYTEQLTKRKGRKTVRGWIESELTPERVGNLESDRSEQSQE